MGKDSIFLKGLATGRRNTLQRVYGQHELQFCFLGFVVVVVFFSSFCVCVGGWGRGHKGGEIDMGGLGSESDQGH